VFLTVHKAFQGHFEWKKTKLVSVTEECKFFLCVCHCVCVCAFQTVQKLFKHRFGKELSFSDRMEFVNLWYFLILVNDAFTIVGSAFKIRLETRVRTEQGVSDVGMEGHSEHFQYTKLLAKQKWKTFDCLLENIVHVYIIITT